MDTADGLSLTHERCDFVRVGLSHARLRPDERAFTFLDSHLNETCSLTFRELDAQARAVAAALQQRVGAAERVLLLIPSGAQFVTGFLGCLYAGVIAVPASLPQTRKPVHRKRVEGIIRDAGVRLVLTAEPHLREVREWIAGLAPQNDLECLDVSVTSQHASTWQMPQITPESIALLQYTSGSTSAPKGVVVTHANLMANETLIQQCFQESGRAIVVNWLPLYHDMGLIGNILQPFFRGDHAVSMAPMTFLAEPVNWLRALSTYRATSSGAPNFAYQLCVDRVSDEQLGGLDLSSWRLAYVGSEPIRATTLDAFAAKFGAIGFRRKSFCPCYGLAEATLFVSGATRGCGATRIAVQRESLRKGYADPVAVPGSGDDVQVLVSCGSTLTGQSVAIVDAQTGLRCPQDRVGEIWLRHPSVAAGYWSRPQETAATFGGCMTGERGERFLRTGDLGFIHRNELYVTGRIKDLIIIRGSNHAPQDIELTAQECDAQLQRDGGAAFSIDNDGEEHLVLVQEVSRHAARMSSVDGLMSRIRAAIIENHSVQPYEIVLIRQATLPRTTSGKIRRQHTKALYLSDGLSVVGRLSPVPESAPGSDQGRIGLSTAYVAPETELERQLARLLHEVVGIEPGAEDSLFELGVDSLAATRFIARIHSRWPRQITLQDVHGSPTIRGIARKLALAGSAGAPEPPLVPQERGAPVPLSYEQRRMWLLEKIRGSEGAYNIALTARIRGPLDVPALQAALDALLQRHETLRTVFPDVDGKPMVVIADRVEFALQLVDIGAFPGAQHAAAMRELQMQEASSRFALGKGPLIRGRLLRLGDDDHVLLLTLHHIVSDGWSTAILIRDLAALYAIRRGANGRSLDPPGIQYSDYAIWQSRFLTDERLQPLLTWWKERLAGAPVALEVPTDLARAPLLSSRGGSCEIVLSDALTRRLGDWAISAHATVFATLLTAVNLLLSVWSGQRDIVLGTVAAGRKREPLEQVVGVFVNFVPIRTRMDPDQSVSDLLARVSSHLIELHAFDECPFDLIVEALNPPRSAGRNPLFNVGFLYQNFPAEAVDWGELSVEVSPSADASALLDLRFIATQRHGRIACVCEYSADLFTMRTVEHLLRDFERVLEQIVDEPAQPVSSVGISEPLREQALASRERERSLPLKVAANFVVEPLEETLIFWSEVLGTHFGIEITPYDQVFQQLVDPDSACARNRDGANVVLLSVAEWLRDLPADRPRIDCEGLLRRNAEELLRGVGALQERTSAPLLVCLCPPVSAGAVVDTDVIREVHDSLAARLGQIPGVQCLTHAQVTRLYPGAAVDYSREHFTALGTMIARRVSALWRTPRKVIIVDCDETLWKGVCGEDGPDGVEVSPAHAAVQEFLVRQHEEGLLICLCSRNNPADVEAVFRGRKDMRLREEHIIASRIGWGPKSLAVAELAQELNVGLDSVVFIDDSAMECSEVSGRHPAVATLQLPQEYADRPAFLQHAWVFDRASVTHTARERARYYRENQERERALAQYSSLAEFLESLELRVGIGPMEPQHIDRVAELTWRTNQFNLTSIRRQVPAIRQFALSAHSQVLVVHVRDRFGDYGLVGTVFLELERPRILVDTFLLSCRVLGRGVEYRLLNELGRLGREGGFETIELRYTATPRNRPALEFLESVAGSFRHDGADGTTFRMPVEQASSLVMPATSTPPARVPDSNARPAGPPWIESTRRMQLIADQLRTVDQIDHAITVRFAKTRQTDALYAAPRTAVEAAVVSIWKAVLNINTVSIHDDFFQIGGRSVLATQIMARIHSEFGIDIPLEEFLETPSVAALSSRIEAYRWALEPASGAAGGQDENLERILL